MALFTVLALTFGGDPAPTSDIDQIVAMSADQAASGQPVTVEGLVYYCETDGSFFFLGSKGKFIFVHNPREFLEVGTRVRISGRTDSGTLQNTIRVGSLEVLGREEPDAPIELDLRDLAPGESDCVWVQKQCVIQTVRVNRTETIIQCRADDVDFQVRYAEKLSRPDATALLGATVRIQGNLAIQYQGQPGSFVIAVPRSHFTVVTPPPSPLPVEPPRTAHELWNDENATTFCIEGQVTFIEGGGMFLEQNQIGTYIHNDERIPIQIGEFVCVSGDREPERKHLNARLIVERSKQPLSVPPVVTASQVKESFPESLRIRTRGKLEAYEYKDGRLMLSLSDGFVSFAVKVPMGQDELKRLSLDTADEIVVAGTCTFSGTDKEFLLAVPELSDLVVTKRNETLASSKQLYLGIGSLLLVVAGGGWILISQVRSKRRDLRRLTAELQASYEAIRDGVLVVGPDRDIIHANRSVAEFFGLQPEQLNLHGIEACLQVNDATAFSEQWTRLSATDEVCNDMRLEISTPSPRTLSVFSAPVKQDASDQRLGRLWVFTDITEQQKLQSQLVHAQRQEAVGQLAGGFAHDFNNLLTGVIASLDLAMLQDGSTSGNIRKHLTVASDAATRSAQLVQKLLSFSRKTTLNLQPCDANRIVQSAIELFGPSLPAEISLTFSLAEQLPSVVADKTQLEQVLLNICLNASAALAGEGTIKICTSTRIESRDQSDNQFVVITVTDTGHGMTREVREQMFEPFFTTKEGKGTGLGLAMSQGIIQQHNGWIECDSKENVGTEFRIVIPATSQPVAAPVASDNVPSSLTGRRVLVIDDEDIVRDTLEQLLSGCGADVVTAASGPAALELLDVQSFDVVMVDWKMPDMSGREVLRHIHETRPSLPTIVCSGNVSDCNKLEDTDGPDAVLQKPFGATRMASEINRAISLAQNRRAAATIDEASR